MFASHDNGPSRKHFQKPNILRRKPKVTRVKQKYPESPVAASLNGSGGHGDIKIVEHSARSKQDTACDQQLQYFVTNNIQVNIINDEIKLVPKLDTNIDHIPLFDQNEQIDNKGSLGLDAINIESFLIDGKLKQENPLPHSLSFTIEEADDLVNKDVETELKNKQCLNFVGNDFREASYCFFDGSQLHNIITQKSVNSVENTAVPPHVVSLLSNTDSQECDKQTEKCNNPVSSRNVKFQCDEPNCDKEFWSEVRMQNHKNSHQRLKENVHVDLACPAKRTIEDGTETQCGRIFPAKSELLAHINEDHTLEDALYKCSRCGRRFFWAGGARGARAHEHGGCGRAFACTWAGCGRVFRQLCRLREHARVHTGDRPYPCHYPNCGWSFRSASKLVRHVRRHTGERRHACADCGRAFLRREHLRDHAARHHQPRHTPCRHDGCDKTFNNTSLLYLHMKNVHRKDGEKRATTNRRGQRASKAKKDTSVIPTDTETSLMDLENKAAAKSIELTDTQDWAMDTQLDGSDGQLPHVTGRLDGDVTGRLDGDVTGRLDGDVTRLDLVPSEHVDHLELATDDNLELESQEEEDQMHGDVTAQLELAAEVDDLRAARTHCTWPLQRHLTQQYVLEDDMQSEQPEGSESNIYTVRSDLFLHGNVLINEDSEFTISRESAGGVAADARAPHIDGLGLIDAHPTIDLMQEELMYADAAVDESSFRVFLLNGEELT